MALDPCILCDLIRKTLFLKDSISALEIIVDRPSFYSNLINEGRLLAKQFDLSLVELIRSTRVDLNSCLLLTIEVSALKNVCGKH